MEKILIVGAAERYRIDLVLEPVGMDFDGAIKPIGELSFDPNREERE